MYWAFGSGLAESVGCPAAAASSLARASKHPFRLANPRQPTLASLQFRRQLVAAPIRAVLGILGRVRRLRLREQLLHLVTQLPLFVPHPVVTHRLVLRRVRLHLAAVERHAAHPRRPQFARQPQHLLEEALQGGQVRLPEIGDGAKVRGIAGRQHAKRHVLEQPALDPARREDPDAVGVHQHLRQHDRVIRRVAAFLVLIHRRDGRQIQLIDQVAHEVRQMILRQPVPQARRQQQVLLGHVRAIGLGHRRQCSTSAARRAA